MYLAQQAGIIGFLFMMGCPACFGVEFKNVATPDRGAYVLASSFANYNGGYPDNAIDGDAGTEWSALDDSFPQWLEILWPEAETLSEVRLHPGAGIQLGRWRVEAFQAGHWNPVAQAENQDAVQFKPIETERLRVWIDSATGGPLRLASLEAWGKAEERGESLKPYWSSSYIWYPEKNQKLEIGQPRYFFKEFEIDDLNQIKSSYLLSLSNDFYEAYLNGKKVSEGSKLAIPVDVRAILRAGRNVLVYKAVAQSDPGWSRMILLGELILQTTQGRKVIGTDSSWISSDSAPDDWNQADFKPAGWLGVAVLSKPPEGVWGRIPYSVPGQASPVEVLALEIQPENPKPGDTVKMRFQLRLPSQLKSNYAIGLRAGEMDVNSEIGNYQVAATTVVPQPSLADWKAQTPQWVEMDLRLPSWAPNGKTPLYLSGVSTSGQGDELRFYNPAGPPYVGEMNIVRPGWKAPTVEAVTARPGYEGYLGCFKIGDQILPPYHWSAMRWSLESFQCYGDTGMKIFEVPIDPFEVSPHTDYQWPLLAFLNQQITNLLRVVPDARILIAGDARASGAWKIAHPEALMLDAFGHPKAESVANKTYRAAAADYVRRIVDFVNQQPYANRVIGYKFALGPEPDAYIGGTAGNEGVTDRATWTIGDWNPDAIAAFRDFLRKKYKDDTKALQTAWCDDKVDFTTAQANAAVIVHELPDHNLFRDPRAGRMPADYCEFLSSLVPSTYDEVVSPIIRQATQGRAWVSSWIGFVVECLRGIQPASTQQNNDFWLPVQHYAVDTDNFAGTDNYENRMAGMRAAPFQLISSIDLNGKMSLLEMDYRTFISGYKTYGRLRSEAETVAVLRRDLDATFIRGQGAYLADWSLAEGRVGQPFFLDSSMLDCIRKIYKIYGDALSHAQDIKPTTQIAVIIAPEAVWHQDVAYPAVVYNSLIRQMVYENMAALGASYDTLQVDDLRFPQVQSQYKLFIFVNPFYLRDSQVQMINRLKGHGKTLAFFYAPGYVSDEHGLSVKQVSAVAGMEVGLIPGRLQPEFSTIGLSHALLKDTTPAEKVTIDPFDSAGRVDKISPAEIFPNFEITDAKAVALGRDSEGRVRYAVKEFSDWNSVYSTVPNLSAHLLRNLVEYAGVHCYTPPGFVVDANSRYLSIHYGGAAPRKVEVSLLRPASVKELYSNQNIPVNGANFTVEMPKQGTFLYELSNAP